MSSRCDTSSLYAKITDTERGYLDSVLSTVEGRAVIWLILRELGTREPSYDPSGVGETYFADGVGFVGHSIEYLVRARGRQHLRRMEDEAVERDEIDRSVDRASRVGAADGRIGGDAGDGAVGYADDAF